jgi:nicotinate phosphoribosyltransferase
MALPTELYRPSLALFTDFYELTMAYGYWKSGLQELPAAFHHSFRENPFAGGFTLACGLSYVVDYLENLRFSDDDLAYLATLRDADDRPLFEAPFLDELGSFRFACDVDAVPEGTVVFPHEPLVQVRGPILQAQLVESAILNFVNFQTLIATKAARVCLAARGEPVLEFGLRRAQGLDGALSASRAAYVGGCAATSNVLAGRLFGIPVRGTHAHSWVLAFEDEQAAFEAYARALPASSVFLVDTYDTLRGVRHAIEVGQRLRQEGRDLAGVRLDSGDLAYLSQEARHLLDKAGFAKTSIIASNDLDEHIISSLKEQGAAITVWGVGTRLVTGFGDPALGGVYKLSALGGSDGSWHHKVKVSEQAAKVSTPGILNVRRFAGARGPVADAIYDELSAPRGRWTIVDPTDATRRRTLPAEAQQSELLTPIFQAGRRVYNPPTLAETRQNAQAQLASFHAGVKRFVNPHRYPVGLERSLFDLKTRLILAARGHTD